MGFVCPVDKEKLVAVAVSKDTLDYCSACHGFWFNGNEICDIEELPVSELMIEFQDELDNGEITDSKEGKENPNCVLCEAPMKRFQYNLPRDIWVYGCPSGDGIWIEKNETLKIHRHLEKSAKALPKEKQKTLSTQLKTIEEDADRKAEETALTEFSGEKKSKIPLPHLMDGVCRFMAHMLFKIN